MSETDAFSYEGEHSEPRFGRGLNARMVLLAIIAAVVIAIGLDNRQSVSIGWVIGKVQIPLVLALVVALLLGVGAGMLISWRRHRA